MLQVLWKFVKFVKCEICVFLFERYFGFSEVFEKFVLGFQTLFWVKICFGL